MKFVISYLSLIVYYSFVYSQVTLSSSAQKKINKTIGLLWQGVEVKKEQVKITDSMLTNSKLKSTDVDLYTIKNKDILLGYLYIDETKSKTENFSYCVFFKPDLSIKSVQLLDYRESYGSEVGSTRWLKQFNDKTNGERLEFEKDIKNISGATITAKSISFGIKRLSLNIQELRRLKII